MNTIKIEKLDNGITVVMEKIDYVQSAAFGVWVRAGAIDESPVESGVSHFIEHMMFKGTDTRNARELAEDIDKIGGQINAFTGKEATCYYVKTIGANLYKGIEVVIDMLNNSQFDTVEMDKERQVIFEEMKMIEDQPDELAFDTISELVFKGRPLGKSIIGTEESLSGIDRNRLVAYRNREYTKDSIVVSVAGNFDEKEFIEFISDKFESFGDKKEKKNEELAPYVPNFKTIVKDIQQTHFCIGCKGVSLGDENYYKLALLNSIMGGSMSSRLFQNIREEKGLAYSVYSMSSAASNDGYFNIYAGVSHEKIKDALNGIKEELEILEKSGVTREELSKAKEQMKSSFIFSQENVASRMFANGKNVILLGRVYDEKSIISDIDKVTLSDIDEIKKLITDPENYCGVIVTDDEFDLKGNW